MDFILSEEQRMLKDTVARIAGRYFAPIAAEVDEQERFPSESVKVLTENGLLGSIFRKNTVVWARVRWVCVS